jgi:hypothetical protein
MIQPRSVWKVKGKKEIRQVMGTAIEPVSQVVYVLYAEVADIFLKGNLIVVKREAGLPQAQFGLSWYENDVLNIQWHITYQDNPIFNAIAIFAEEIEIWNRTCIPV